MFHVHHTSVPGLLTQYLHRLVLFATWDSAQPGAGTYLMSSSYDKTCKIFSCQDWSLVKTLSGHEDKVMRAEISPGAVFHSVRRLLLWDHLHGRSYRCHPPTPIDTNLRALLTHELSIATILSTPKFCAQTRNTLRPFAGIARGNCGAFELACMRVDQNISNRSTCVLIYNAAVLTAHQTGQVVENRMV
jgi:hypothetical protein